MDTDDLDPPRAPFGLTAPAAVPLRDLEVMGLDQLADYIAGLEAEISRARDTIARKEKARDAAEAFFKPR